MDYIEVQFSFHQYDPILELLKQDLCDIGFDSFQDHPKYISGFISKGDYAEDSILNKLKNYSSLILSFEKIIHPYQNWNKIWESNFEPIKINEDCLIRASFHNTQSFKYEIIIDPEMSFGTGHHETTRLIANALFDFDLDGKKVLDFGAGTGILAILSEKLLAKQIDAVEIESSAINNAKSNAEKNNCNKINFINGDGKSIPDLAYDLLLVNINKNTILKQFEYFKKTLKKDTVVLFSGFYESDIASIEEMGQLNGLNPLYSNLENNWALVAMKYN